MAKGHHHHRHGYWTARRKRGAARLALVLVLLALASIPAPRYYERRRARLTHIAALDPHFREEWEADRPWKLPGSCETRLGAVMPLDPTAAAFSLERSRLYGAFASGLERKGLDVFAPEHATDAASTQGLGLASLFDFHPRSGRVTARLHRLDVPVRAIVVPLPGASHAARKISTTTRRVLGTHFPGYGSKDGVAGHGDSVWYQDPAVYHFSVYHASHHQSPVTATPAEERTESAAIEEVCAQLCPIRAVVERVVVAPSGAVLALWNVVSGAEPADLRSKLRAALPNSPAAQIVSDRAIMHTTVARLLRPPLGPMGAPVRDRGAGAARKVAAAMTKALCGLEVVLPAAWFVRERDKLALALGGEYEPEEMPFMCEAGGGERLD